MKNYRFILEKRGSCHTCPGCGKRREFTRYVDTRTGELLPEQYGICNRLDKCGYNLNPYKEGYAKKVWEQDQGRRFDSWKYKAPSPMIQPKAKPSVSFIPNEVVKASLYGYEGNYFVQYLTNLFGDVITSELIGRYFIGSSKHQFQNRDHPGYISEGGANVFWQIDINGRVRSGKVMLYNSGSGKRIKKPFNHVTWIHKKLGLGNFELSQCLFGEHLLIKNEISPVAIVESEKTAIIGSVYLPQFVWLACGAMNNLNAERCRVLKGRHVVLFPDLNAFEKWDTKAKELTQQIPGTLFSVSDLLEKGAKQNERREGLDLADYLTRIDLNTFRPSEKSEKDEALNKSFFSQNLGKLSIQSNTTIPETDNNNQHPITPKETLLYNPHVLLVKPDSEKGENCETENKHYFSSIEGRFVKGTNWDSEISELEGFFCSAFIPDGPLSLSEGTTISDPAKFIDSHLATIKFNNGKRTFAPFLHRLQVLQAILKSYNYEQKQNS